MSKSGYVTVSVTPEQLNMMREINKEGRQKYEIKYTKAKNRYVVHVHQDGKGSWQDEPIEPLIVRKLSNDEIEFKTGDKVRINYNKKYGFWYFD